MDIDLIGASPLIAAFFACLIAQFLKPFIYWFVDRKFDFRLFFTTGSMPSSHTATVVALTTCVACVEGPFTVATSIAAVFSAIVIHDAMGIRRQAGKQAEMINEWNQILQQVKELREMHYSPKKLKTMLGHTFSQVFFGFLLGLVVGFVTYYIIVNPY